MADERELAKEERAKLKSKRRGSGKKRYPTQTPWGLVLFIVLGLGLLGLYIGWLNAPDNTKGGNILSYLFGNAEDKPTVDQLSARSDSLAIWADSPLTSTTLDQDVPTDGLWGDDPVADPAPVTGSPFQDEVPVVSTPPPALAPSVQRTPPTPATGNESLTGSKTYQVVAGRFKSRGSAQMRIRELRQGNYPARLVESSSADAPYEVVVGEFKSYNRAKSKANEIGFILEIEASVEEKKQ